MEEPLKKKNKQGMTHKKKNEVPQKQGFLLSAIGKSHD